MSHRHRFDTPCREEFVVQPRDEETVGTPRLQHPPAGAVMEDECPVEACERTVARVGELPRGVHHVGRAGHRVEVEPGDRAVHGSQLQGSVVLVDHHHQGLVPIRARVPALEFVRCSKSVVPVSDDKMGVAQRINDHRLWLTGADLPQPMELVCAVGVDEVGGRRGDGTQDVAHVLRAVVDQQQRSRVESSRLHPVDQLLDLGGVDTLVRMDPVAARGELDSADEATHDDSVRGVFVHIDEGLGVHGEPALLFPVADPVGHSRIGFGQDATCRGLADMAVGEAQGSEAGEVESTRRSVGIHSVDRMVLRVRPRGTMERHGVAPRGRWSVTMTSARLVDEFDHLLFDLDGVVYRGRAAVPGAVEALTAARAAGLRLSFVTNNAGRPPAVVAEHLAELGIQAAPTEVVTAAQAAARLVAQRHPRGAPVFLAGGEGVHAALEEVGLTPVTQIADDPVAVVTGFGSDLPWQRIVDAGILIRSGVPWTATNGDLTFPTGAGLGPGHGAVVELLERFSGKRAEIAGKPRPALLHEAVRRQGGERPLMVGDRLDTDIAGANAAGFSSLLVLTGVSVVADLAEVEQGLLPTYVGVDLGALHAQGIPVSSVLSDSVAP